MKKSRLETSIPSLHRKARAGERSPFNEGTLCPKGAAIYQLHINPNRPTNVLHRAPGATSWEVWDLERAMARRATLDNEWNHIHQKLLHGLGIVAIENQARI